MISAFALLAPSITLAFVGDVMLGRGIEKQGIDPFARYSPEVLRKADWAFANLECPLTDAPFARHKLANLRAKPSRVSWLEGAGIDCVSVANNHTGDCGEAGFEETLRTLSGEVRDVAPLRTRTNKVSFAGVKGKPVIAIVKGVRVGLLAYSDFPRDAASGVAVGDLKTLPKDIVALRPNCDVLVVSFHWGVEGTDKPSGRQKAYARACAESGADIVVGHGPHKVQPVERIGKTLVAFSLGDFVFDRKGPRAIWRVRWDGKKGSGELLRVGERK